MGLSFLLIHFKIELFEGFIKLQQNFGKLSIRCSFSFFTGPFSSAE
jgi:hypothetical protein